MSGPLSWATLARTRAWYRAHIFVRVVWDTECGLERCTIARAEGSQATAYLEFSRPISTMSELSEQLARAIAEIEAGLC
jgi:hypothetical protein